MPGGGLAPAAEECICGFQCEVGKCVPTSNPLTTKPTLQLTVRFPPVTNETDPEAPGENPGGAQLSAELKRVKKIKKAGLVKKYEAKLLEQKQVWNPNATKLNTGDRVRLDKIVDEKLKLAMAQYRAEMDGFAPSGDDLLTSTPQGPPPPPTPLPVKRLGSAQYSH